ncbi:MAG: MarC family protein [Solirubrobacteraceae bacterium]
MLEDLLTTAGVSFAALFPIVNPLSTVPVFHTLSAHMSDERRHSEARKAALATFLILTVFLFVGRFVLDFFGISLPALEVAGGLVVGYAAWQMITVGVAAPPAADEDEHASIYMSPITMPLQAGPGALGVTLGLATRHENVGHYLGNVIGIAAIALVSLVLLLHGGRPMRLLGRGGMDALVRTLGLIVLAIAVELVYHGVTAADL